VSARQFVSELVAAGGTMRIVEPDWSTRLLYERQVRDANSQRRMPTGKRARIEHHGDDLIISLGEVPLDVQSPEAEPITIDERIARLHRTARAFRDNKARHQISKALLPRATRIVHAIATEAERRGWTVATPEEQRNGYGHDTWSPSRDGHLRITVNERRYWIRVHEPGVKTRGPWDAETAHLREWQHRWPASARPEPRAAYDDAGSGELRIEVQPSHRGAAAGRQSRFGDTRLWKLEDRLTHVVLEIAERIVEDDLLAEEKRLIAERRAQAAREAADTREGEWHELMASARAALAERHRAETLHAEISAWREAQSIRAYADAHEFRGAEPSAAEWITWARSYADRIDPSLGDLAMPAVPEATHDQIQKLLPPGWSATGPHDGPNARTFGSWRT
jgi:hypothetical protein